MVRSDNHRAGSTRTLLLLCAVLVFSLFPLQPASASVTPTGYPSDCGSGFKGGICKYFQTKVTQSGATVTFEVRGSTASGTCDRSNNVTAWQRTKTEVWVNGTLNRTYTSGSVGKNCSIGTSYKENITYVKPSGTNVLKFFYRQQVGGVWQPEQQETFTWKVT